MTLDDAGRKWVVPHYGMMSGKANTSY